jgi:predicted neutral ceramidase superfamily lipid hydrolase
MISPNRGMDAGMGSQTKDEDREAGAKNGGGEPRETTKERIDRELIELLNELRVVLPGIQVLFAFQLTIPFSQRFTDINSTQRTAYFISLLCTAVSSILLIAPPVIHRLRFRERDKEQILKLSNKLTILGTIFLALAIAAVVFVITDLLYGTPLSIVVTAVVAVLMLAVWYVTPLVRRARAGTASPSEASD